MQKQYRIILIPFLLALVIRLVVSHLFVGLSVPPDLSAAPDQADYDAIAWQIANNFQFALPDGTLTMRRPPGTSMMLSIVYMIFGHSYLAARIFIILLSALTCSLVALVCKELFNSRIALLAGSILAIAPGSFYYSMHLLSEPFFCFWIMLAVYTSMLARKNEKNSFNIFSFLASICWAMAILTRPHLLIILFFMLVYFLRKKKTNYCSKEKSQLLWQVIIVVLLVLPWSLRNYYNFKSSGFSTSISYTFLGAHNEKTFSSLEYVGSWYESSKLPEIQGLPKEEALRSSKILKLGINNIAQEPWSLVYLIPAKLLRLFSPYEDIDNNKLLIAFLLQDMVFVPLFLIGFIRSLSSKDLNFRELGWIVFATLITAVIFYGSIRFRHSMLPVMLVYICLSLRSSYFSKSSCFISQPTGTK